MVEPPKFWPLQTMVAESEMTDHHRQVVEFMDDAYKSGFAPRIMPSEAYFVENADGRSVLLVRRGTRNGYEPMLQSVDETVSLCDVVSVEPNKCITIRPFSSAGVFTLRWLRGENIDEIIDDFNTILGVPIILELKAKNV